MEKISAAYFAWPTAMRSSERARVAPINRLDESFRLSIHLRRRILSRVGTAFNQTKRRKET